MQQVGVFEVSFPPSLWFPLFGAAVLTVPGATRATFPVLEGWEGRAWLWSLIVPPVSIPGSPTLPLKDIPAPFGAFPHWMFHPGTCREGEMAL